LSQEATEYLFSDKEASFLCQGGLGRLATVSPDGQPHVVPVAYEFDGRFIYFSGRNLARSLKYRHVSASRKVAFVVDDVVSVSPWRVRGVEVRGTAEVLNESDHPYVKITPSTKASWGL
jgi:pyridoxamine 5'-phosphate oxidase family protein